MRVLLVAGAGQERRQRLPDQLELRQEAAAPGEVQLGDVGAFGRGHAPVLERRRGGDLRDGGDGEQAETGAGGGRSN